MWRMVDPHDGVGVGGGPSCHVPFEGKGVEMVEEEVMEMMVGEQVWSV